MMMKTKQQEEKLNVDTKLKDAERIDPEVVKFLTSSSVTPSARCRRVLVEVE